MSPIKILLLFLYLSVACNLKSQNTVGVLKYQPEAMEAYTFFSPFSGTKAYLVDNCGNLINSWDRGIEPGLSAYFLENGNLFRTFKANLKGPFTSASNAGGIELVNWKNEVIWSYEVNSLDQLSHHDAVFMPNGHILILTWKLVYKEQLVQMGRNPTEIAPENFMWSERILELAPKGDNDAEIVWEWNIYDHYIQDFDETKSNFGVISEHPELFDINLPELNSSNSNSTRDWNHFNAIDYNEELDQILVSVRNSDEIWILDHSTTIEESTGHEGGKYGKGGDILYRWGNAASYQLAEVSNQKLFGQHGVHWVKSGLKDEGKIMIFNNGNGRPGNDYSQIDVLDPPQSEPGFYFREDDKSFGPEAATTIYGEIAGENFYSPYLSNAQSLPNGNVLINSGSPGNIFEINPNREIVWEYEIPLFGDFPATQGQNVNNNSNFRAYKYVNDYKGFDGINIVVGDPIENNPSDCEVLVGIEESLTEIQIYYDGKEFHFSTENHGFEIVEIYNISGIKVYTDNIGSNNRYKFQKEIETGVYFAKFRKGNQIELIKIVME